MADSYKTVYLGGEEEIERKKSRFIAAVEHVESEEEALVFIEGIRKKHWSARHNCFAYIIGTGSSPLMRCSDDGEPQGTAGRPMLDVLIGSEICNIVVVVTRYFGGTLLGTGGLVRAYSDAVKEGIEGSMIIERIRAVKTKISCDYSWVGKIQYIAGSEKIRILDSDYGESVEFTMLIPCGMTEQFHNKIIQATNGQVTPVEGDECFYAEADGECILFDH